MVDKDELIRPEHKFPLIHGGYNPSVATLEGLADDNAFIEEHFGNLEGPLVLLNNGGLLIMSTGADHPDEEGSFGHKARLPAFGIYNLKGDDGTPIFAFSTVNTGNNPESGYSFPIKDTTLRTSKTERLHILNISLRGRSNYDITIWPYGGDEFRSVVAVPFLPVEKRDAMFWQGVAEAYGLALGEPTLDENGGLVTYEALIPNSNVSSLRLTSNPNYGRSSLIIDATFNEPVEAAHFKQFGIEFGALSRALLDGRHVIGSVLGGRTGRELHAEISKANNYLASGLIKHIAGMG